MELVLKRIAKKDTYTIGHLYVDGKYECDTLEPTDRMMAQSMSVRQLKRLKVDGKTAIPTGTYTVGISYSQHFKRDLPIILYVKGFLGVRIHTGNSSIDTEGCILVGKNKKKGMVLDSRITFNNLFEKIRKAYDSGKRVTIKVE